MASEGRIAEKIVTLRESAPSVERLRSMEATGDGGVQAWGEARWADYVDRHTGTLSSGSDRMSDRRHT